MSSILLITLFRIVTLILGMYILIAGRRYLWATTGVVSLIASANLLAVLAAGLDGGWDLIEAENWQLLLIAFGVGVVGALLGRFQKIAASAVVGFVAGADITRTNLKIVVYISEQIAGLPENTARWIGLAIMLVGGVIGIYLTLKYPRRALVLISVFIGAEIIYATLGLNPASNLTAVILLSLALVGVVVQYAEYARETQKLKPIGVPVNPIDERFDLEET